jgi:hypothetical protein
MSLIEPFNLERILVVDLAGNPEVFSFVAIFLLSIVMGKYNFGNKIALSLFALFTIILSAWLQNIYVLVIIVTGLTTFYAVSKFANR